MLSVVEMPNEVKTRRTSPTPRAWCASHPRELSWLVGEEAPGVLVREHDPTITAYDEQSVRNELERRESF